MNEQLFSGNSVVTVPNENEINENAVRPVKRIAAIHDLSCFGRCALTVVIPALSALGYQVVPIPTALLSTHTGGFSGIHFSDLTDSMPKICDHFEKLSLTFDAIYTGFLGSVAQIDIVEDFICRFGKTCTVMVDPVMGDDGMLYSTYTDELMRGMSRLCKHADIITPNLTEACFLTGIPYKNTAKMSETERSDYLDRICSALETDKKKKIVITGVCDGEDKLAIYGIDPDTDPKIYHTVPRISKNYPGTGDIFASVLLGEFLRTEKFDDSASFASDFTSGVMRYTAKFDTPTRDGVALEAFLGELTDRQRIKQ
jgi:pyridoxine kinase